jgi:hypothetical protein
MEKTSAVAAVFSMLLSCAAAGLEDSGRRAAFLQKILCFEPIDVII